jgi:hypothetical protein
VESQGAPLAEAAHSIADGRIGACTEQHPFFIVCRSKQEVLRSETSLDRKDTEMHLRKCSYASLHSALPFNQGMLSGCSLKASDKRKHTCTMILHGRKLLAGCQKTRKTTPEASKEDTIVHSGLSKAARNIQTDTKGSINEPRTLDTLKVIQR